MYLAWRPIFQRAFHSGRLRPFSWRARRRPVQLPGEGSAWCDVFTLGSAVTMGLLSVTVAKSWVRCDEEFRELHLSQRDEALLLSVLDGGVANLQKWTQAPASWWDDSRQIRISGLKDCMHYIKRLEGFPIKLQMVTAVWEEVALDDLLVLSEASDNCLKLTFDPVIDTMTTRLHFGGGIRKGRVLRTMTRPTLMGIIQAREVDSVLREPEIMADGWVVGGGLGLQSPLLVDKIQESEYLKALAAVPPSKGKVRAIDHTSEYLFQPLDDAARSASSAKGTWKVHYILLSEAGGGVPLWAAEKGVLKAIIDWYTAAHKEWVRRQTVSG
ncbi:unnamed protein product [Durusdinium trenchii]|uniref:Uncharacterized protein n=1 Tax=Durusdinium trenchii TaxID=1381693 RepID=A0ABP0P0H2_9DINO